MRSTGKSKTSIILSTKTEKKRNALKSTPKSIIKPPAPAVVAPNEDEEWEDDDSEADEDGDEDDDGVDEEGMARLMELLGDDGLDEFGQAQLDALAREDDDDDGSSNEVEASGDAKERGAEDEDVESDALSSEESGESDHDDDQGVEEEEGDGEEVIPLDEVDFVDEDAVPRQKIEIDNKVRFPYVLTLFLRQIDTIFRSLLTKFASPFS
jgi:rRNA-processing protein EBP2